MATARAKGRGYEIRVSMGYDMNGKKITKSKTWIPPKQFTPKQLEKELERQKVLFEEEVKTGRLFTQWNGKPMYPDSLTKCIYHIVDLGNTSNFLYIFLRAIEFIIKQ